MVYKGAWSRGQRFTPAPGANPNLGAGASTLHLDPVDPVTGWEEPTPTLPALPPSMYGDEDWQYPVPVLAGDVALDREPETHFYGGVSRGDSLIEGQQLAGVAHSQDYGAADAQFFEPPIQRAVADTYQTQRIQAEFATSTSRAALTRGRNSLPENNPDGPPPQGHYVMRWIDRQFTRRGIRTDMQPLRPYRAAVAAQAPEPGPAAANAYTSPFARLMNARQRKLTTPEVRRVPRAPDEFAEMDGTEDPQYSQPAYWEW